MIHRYTDMLELLDEMCDNQGQIGLRGRSEATGFANPRLANVRGWKLEARAMPIMNSIAIRGF